jgi:hypothetical protein
MVSVGRSFSPTIKDGVSKAFRVQHRDAMLRRVPLEKNPLRSGFLAIPIRPILNWPTLVYGPHDFLCPANRIGNCSDGRRHTLSTIVLRELACSEDGGGDQQHALATFVHADHCSIFAFCSP